jgi:hypothetical protein
MSLDTWSTNWIGPWVPENPYYKQMQEGRAKDDDEDIGE